MVDEHTIMLVKLSFNWFSKDCGFNTKTHSWYGIFVMNDIKEMKELGKQLVGQTFVEH